MHALHIPYVYLFTEEKMITTTISPLVFTRCVLLGAWGRGGRGAGAGRGRWALGAGPAETGERALPNFAFDGPGRIKDKIASALGR